MRNINTDIKYTFVFKFENETIEKPFFAGQHQKMAILLAMFLEFRKAQNFEFSCKTKHIQNQVVFDYVPDFQKIEFSEVLEKETTLLEKIEVLLNTKKSDDIWLELAEEIIWEISGDCESC